jgi:protein phosphatase
MASENAEEKTETPPPAEPARPEAEAAAPAQADQETIPVAMPVDDQSAAPEAQAIPVARPVNPALWETPPAAAQTEAPPPFPVDLEIDSPRSEGDGWDQLEVVPAEILEPDAGPIDVSPPAADVVPEYCAACGQVRKPGQAFCGDCGFMFPKDGALQARLPGQDQNAADSSPVAPARVPPMPTVRIKGRYEIGELLTENAGICRYRAHDHGSGTPVPVIILWAAQKQDGDPVFEGVPMAAAEEEIMPGFDEIVPVAQVAGAGTWPSIVWEKNLLERARHPSLPAVLDYFQENNFEFLVEEAPQGKSLWDAWDEPDADASVRYSWLVQIAEGMQALQKAGALIEGMRPEFATVNARGQAMIADLSELLPLPLPPDPPVKATLYTAPELILNPHEADARAGLYSFGAMLYSLEYLHHPLEEKDFESPYAPKQITDRFPDVHPLFFRLINKTFVRDLHTRFPTDEAVKVDPSGFAELIRALDVCRRNFDNVRLDIAAWTTTGMVRTGNEDAFALLHGVEARMDDLWEYAMVLLCDGMGGYEAGEVAAALAIAEMRKYLLAQPIFAALTGKEPPAAPVSPKAYQDVLVAALRHANKEVHAASRVPGKGRRGMGCTAECVYVDNRNIIVGHVGDSRTYHLSHGRLVQLTRDQTLVNRLVELGQLSEAEAESHPRKNELQQAIGGQPEVAPGAYSARLKRGDWVLVCSDGLTNHIPTADLEKMLTREAAYSAEEAARRLLNLVNLRGATDNATIVVIRAS